jgi:hypothetical protein
VTGDEFELGDDAPDCATCGQAAVLHSAHPPYLAVGCPGYVWPALQTVPRAVRVIESAASRWAGSAVAITLGSVIGWHLSH